MLVHIDAGHGGKDPGAVYYGLQEKGIALEVAKQLEKRLQKFGVGVQMTRNTDVFVGLEDRAEMANEARVDLFLSIHANAAANSAASGVECHIYGTDGESDSLAVEICKEIAGRLGAKNRGVKVNPGLCVLNSTVMPAVLVELGFLSNAEEANKLKVQAADYAAALEAAVCREYQLQKEGEEMAEKIKMKVNGKEVNVERILQNGYNYIKIRDLAEALDLVLTNEGSVPVVSTKAK